MSKTWTFPSENADCFREAIRVLFEKCCDRALELVCAIAWELTLPLLLFWKAPVVHSSVQSISLN